MPRRRSGALVVLALVLSLLTWGPAAPASALALPAGPLPGGAAAGVPYTASVAATGAGGTVAYGLSAGALPPGLTLNTSTGSISGTPTATGTFNFTVAADSAGSHAAQGYSLTVVCGPDRFGASLAPATVGVAYEEPITYDGATYVGVGMYDTELPPGLGWDGGVIAGTATADGAYTVNVEFTDPAGCWHTQTYTLTVAAPTLEIAPAAIAAGTVGVPYEQAFTTSGGTAPRTIVVTDPDELPPGLSLDQTGILSGTPAAAGTFDFTLEVTDSSVGSFDATQQYSLVVAAPTIVVGPDGLPDGALGAPYAATLSATGGNAPRTFAVSAGSLPPGLALGTGGGISGTPSASGSYAFTVTASDGSSGGPYTGSRGYVVEVNQAPTITRQPTGATVRTGDAIDLVAGATGWPVPTVRWQVANGDGWTDVPGATGTTLHLADVRADASYRAVFSSAYGAPATTAVATVHVVAPPAATAPPVVTRDPRGVTVRAGRTVTLTAAASGLPAPTVQWQVRVKKKWKTVKGATASRLVLRKVPQSWNGRAYRAVFTSSAGTVTSKVAVLKVRPRR